MRIIIKCLHRPLRHRLPFGSLAMGAAAVVVAACGSSSPGAAAGAPAEGSSAAVVTIGVKSVPEVGPVLVDGRGRTLYLLTSEKSGKIICANSNSCTQVWPQTVLSPGMPATAGPGIRLSLLGRVKDASGRLQATYNRWPLYTFSGDAGPGVAHGQGLTSFGGTWYVLNAAGNPVTARPSLPSSPSSPAGGGPTPGSGCHWPSASCGLR